MAHYHDIVPRPYNQCLSHTSFTSLWQEADRDQSLPRRNVITLFSPCSSWRSHHYTPVSRTATFSFGRRTFEAASIAAANPTASGGSSDKAVFAPAASHRDKREKNGSGGILTSGNFADKDKSNFRSEGCNQKIRIFSPPASLNDSVQAIVGHVNYGTSLVRLWH